MYFINFTVILLLPSPTLLLLFFGLQPFQQSAPPIPNSGSACAYSHKCSVSKLVTTKYSLPYQMVGLNPQYIKVIHLLQVATSLAKSFRVTKRKCCYRNIVITSCLAK